MTFLDRSTSVPSLVIAVLAVASGSYARAFEEMSGRAVHLTQVKAMLDDVTDTRFLANVVLTAWLVALVVRAPADSGAQRSIRHGSYLRAVGAACRDGLLWAFAVAPVALVAMYVTTLGLPATDDGSHGIDGYPAEVQRPGWPWLAMLLATVVLAVTLLVVLQLLSLTLYLTAPVRRLDVAFAVSVAVLALLSAAGFVDASSPLNLGQLTTVLSIVTAPVAAVVSWATTFATCAMCVVLLRGMDRRRRSLPALLGRRRA
ncbi:hypothetical protein C5B94_14025 [Clavibacter michiganensis]|uniref:hypothetical protein n=1 Tax=Clavibacter michiganensis TaxID=28447 RepID=UPI000CE85BD8|nr:hypothetical protein [Clavibacter michiganensis]PPF51770.1 hypothetical protein C5B94_14025 [Clavibacter michiganensis]